MIWLMYLVTYKIYPFPNIDNKLYAIIHWYCFLDTPACSPATSCGPLRLSCPPRWRTRRRHSLTVRWCRSCSSGRGRWRGTRSPDHPLSCSRHQRQVRRLYNRYNQFYTNNLGTSFPQNARVSSKVSLSLRQATEYAPVARLWMP